MDFEITAEGFKFASWNLFVAACAVPSVLIGLWLFFFPESPKFLLECGEPDEALEVLKNMYASNTGESAASFPVSYFSKKKLFLSSIERTCRCVVYVKK